TQHPALRAPEAARFTCLQVRHEARNNLGAEVHTALEQLLGPVARAGADLPEALGGLAPSPVAPAMARDDGDNDFYRNTFTAVPATLPYRPKTVDGHGLRLHPKPTVHGTQSAIVVRDGAPVQTDRDHRIQVQFAWQRGNDASGQQPHPGGDDNAPGSDGAWTWVRVATPWAGDNWGGVVVPRRGQEVLVAFLDSDIDRPVVVGTVYNGRGQDDAQHNQVTGGGGGATGNAAAWFDGNEHAAVFTGFKSQALAQSQDGSGGYQLLRLDDTPGEGRAQASTTQHETTLTLGHLKGGEDNVRGNDRGFGAELSTQAGGALRAGAGLLLTTEIGSPQLAADRTLAQLAEGEQLLQALADTARGQQATLPDDPDTLPAQATLQAGQESRGGPSPGRAAGGGGNQPVAAGEGEGPAGPAPLAGGPGPRPAQAARQGVQESLRATQQGSAAGGEGDQAIGGGEGEVPGWNAPQLIAGSPDGVLSLTPADQAWVSGTQTTLL